MEDFPVNLADAIVGGVLLLSGVIAFAFGFIRVLLFIASFLGAILAIFQLFQPLKFLARDYIELELIADGVTIVAIFIIAFVLIATVGQLISRRVKGTGMGFLDRTLGFAVGLLSGAVVVSFTYAMMVRLIPSDDQPQWIREARALPLVIYGSQQLMRLAPEDALAEAERVAGTGRDRLMERLSFEDVLRLLLEPAPPAAPETPTDSEAETGYKGGERKQLDRLFEAQDAK